MTLVEKALDVIKFEMENGEFNTFVSVDEEELASCYFADNDLIAVGAIKALKENGYRIPQDIGIVGFDNLPLGSVIEPALTTIHVPKQYMGEAAAQKLIDLLNTPGQPPTKTEVSTMLVKRGTV